MRLGKILLVGIVFGASLASVAKESANALPPTVKVDGLSQAELTVRWWQWAASFQYAESPVSDKTGERCASRQEGPVWFLAGTYGSDVTRRSCRVPAGKHLFFPLVNYVVMPQNCSGCLTCLQATATGRRMTDNVTDLFAELDGKALPGLESHRLASPTCFNLAERDPAASAKIGPTASNGYWLLLPPLDKGRHTLRFGGSLPSLRQELVYTLEVE